MRLIPNVQIAVVACFLDTPIAYVGVWLIRLHLFDREPGVGLLRCRKQVAGERRRLGMIQAIGEPLFWTPFF